MLEATEIKFLHSVHGVTFAHATSIQLLPVTLSPELRCEFTDKHYFTVLPLTEKFLLLRNSSLHHS